MRHYLTVESTAVLNFYGDFCDILDQPLAFT